MYDLPQYNRMLQDLGNSPGEGGPGGPVGSTGATNSGMGLPGIGPTDGTAVGTGNLTGGQAVSAFGQGAVQGLPGVALGNSIANAANNGLNSFGQAATMGLQGLQFAGQLANGINPASLIGNVTLRGLISLANQAQNSTGFRPPTFSESLRDFTQNLKDMSLRSFFGLQTPDESIPDSTFPDTPNVSYPDVDLDPPDYSGNVPGLPDGPTGNDGGTGNANGEGGGDSGGVGGVWYHGGPVNGPPGRDKVPAHLTRGEYVVDADSAKHFRTILDQLNRWEPR